MTEIRTVTITMVNETGIGLTTTKRHLQRLPHQPGIIPSLMAQPTTCLEYKTNNVDPYNQLSSVQA